MMKKHVKSERRRPVLTHLSCKAHWHTTNPEHAVLVVRELQEQAL